MKRFERSNGLDTALYKNYLYLLPHLRGDICYIMVEPLLIRWEFLERCRAARGHTMLAMF